MDIQIADVFMSLLTAVIAYLGWVLRQYQVKVDDHEKRLTKIETVMELLGEIGRDIQAVKTDVEVIKAKLEKSS